MTVAADDDEFYRQFRREQRSRCNHAGQHGYSARCTPTWLDGHQYLLS